MKVVTIIQPAYLPWLGFLDRVAKADLLISLDHVALDANSKTKFATRNKIRTQNGWNWLSVPILSKGNYQKLFLKGRHEANRWTSARIVGMEDSALLGSMQG